jgi:hypothetical protein
MPDILMCLAACPKSRTCYRHPDSGTKPGDYWQSWMQPVTIPCDLYIHHVPNHPTKEYEHANE